MPENSEHFWTDLLKMDRTIRGGTAQMVEAHGIKVIRV